MGRTSPIETVVVDIASVLFVIGGVASLVMSLLTIPSVSIGLPVTFSTVLLIVLAVSLICSLGAVHCYTLATKRMLSEAGIRGMIFGGLLLIFSLGFIGSLAATSATFLAEVSAVLVLIGGIICFILRHAVVSSPLMHH
jgi:hypothetical protein